MLHALSNQDLYTGNNLVYRRPSQQPELKEEMSLVR